VGSNPTPRTNILPRQYPFEFYCHSERLSVELLRNDKPYHPIVSINSTLIAAIVIIVLFEASVVVYAIIRGAVKRLSSPPDG
jgi:hypothetical protein